MWPVVGGLLHVEILRSEKNTVRCEIGSVIYRLMQRERMQRRIGAPWRMRQT